MSRRTRSSEESSRYFARREEVVSASSDLERLESDIAPQEEQREVERLPFVGDLRVAIEKLRCNDLSHVEDMLMQQAHSLHAVYGRLLDAGLGCKTAPTIELLLRIALKAQAQCRATLQTLAAIKNPPAVYAQQANVTTGPQQINNKLVVAPASGEESHELPENGGPSAPAGGADPPMAAVGALDRTADCIRQGEVFAQRLEGRPARTGPPKRQDAS
jgi:hypothetical protein